jgi:dihydroxyacetone kinase-like protein
MNISKDLKGKNKCNHEDIINIINISMDTIQERGKTKLGDKTILDSLNFISNNLKANKNNVNYPELFKSSTKEALDEFKGKKILIGRARMFEDKTKDLDDPGMFALCKLSEVF